MNARAPTQISASAVPSTLESPTDTTKEPPRLDTTERMDDVAPGTSQRPHQLDEISGALILNQSAAGGDPALAAAMKETLQSEPSDPAPARSGGPRTLMSPLVKPGAEPRPRESTRPEDNVTIAPTLPMGGPGYLPPLPPGGPALYGAAGYGQHGQPAPRRSMSSTMIGLLVAGGLVVLLGLGLAVFAFVVMKDRRGDDPLSLDPRTQPAPRAPAQPVQPQQAAPPSPPVTVAPLQPLPSDRTRGPVRDRGR